MAVWFSKQFYNYILGATWSTYSKNTITFTSSLAGIFFHKWLILIILLLTHSISFTWLCLLYVNISCNYAVDRWLSLKYEFRKSTFDSDTYYIAKLNNDSRTLFAHQFLPKKFLKTSFKNFFAKNWCAKRVQNVNYYNNL